MIVERKAIPRVSSRFEGAIERVNNNIAICQERYSCVELVSTYEHLRMDYIKRLAQWYNQGLPVDPIEYNKIVPTLLSLECNLEVKDTSTDDQRCITAVLPSYQKPYYWAIIYKMTGHEFLIQGNKVFFKKKL